ncbi:MAG: translation initiation factor IF-2 N-terminal domain-containing protein, partial [Notoacmeibacter sp.]|nr:translation initiation factor IF-2 N-terminal domain-containing protein [Notoacmeibacter sp.]
MSDSKSGDDKTLHVASKKTLTIKRGGNEQGVVRQNFSHGRTKAVVVETKKRKFTRPDEKPAAETAKPAAPAAPAAPSAPAAARPQAPARPKPAPRPVQSPSRGSGLSSGEMDARRRALEEAKARETEERARAEEEARRRAEEDERRARERAERERQEAEEAARQRAEAEAQAMSEEKQRKRDAEPAKAAKPAPAPADEEETGEKARGGVKRGAPAKPEAAPRAPARPRGDEGRRSGKLTLNRALNDDGEGRGRSLSSMRRRQEKFKRSMQQEPREKIVREVILPETISVQELANRMAERAVDVVKYMMKQGQMIKPGDIIDADTAELIANDFGHTVKRVSESDVEDAILNVEDKAEDLKARPPVV